MIVNVMIEKAAIQYNENPITNQILNLIAQFTLLYEEPAATNSSSLLVTNPMERSLSIQHSSSSGLKKAK